MKQVVCRFTYPVALAAAVVLPAFMVLASPGPTWAASGDQGPGTSIATDRSDGVEAPVKEPPAKVRITPAPVYVPPPFVYNPYTYQSPGISMAFPIRVGGRGDSLNSW